MKARRLTVLCLSALLSVIGVLALAPSASAAHHLVRIRQVYTNGAGMQEFVVLQLTGAGENLFTGGSASVRLFDATDNTNIANFAMDPPNSQNQRTVLVATGAAETAFGVQADLEMNDGNYLNDAAGAACLTSNSFPDIDCVEWGAGTDEALPSATGTLEAAIPTGMLLERSIAANCSTLFETADDTNDSAANFAPATLPAMGTLRNNASPIVETACTGGGGGGTTTPATAPVPTNLFDLPAAIKKCKKKHPKGKKRNNCIKKAKAKEAEIDG